MARSSNDYLKLLFSLLPKGRILNRYFQSNLGKFFDGSSRELARIDDRIVNLFNERDSDITSELLADWERELGLPDGCIGELETIQERRQLIKQRKFLVGRQNEAYFEELAAIFGFDITIVTYTPMWCGLAGAGEPCGDQDNLFYWTVQTVTESNETIFLCGQSGSGDRLTGIDNPTDKLFCTMQKYKPAHTLVKLDVTDTDYIGGAFDISFGLGFDTTGGPFSRGFNNGFEKPGFTN